MVDSLLDVSRLSGTVRNAHRTVVRGSIESGEGSVAAAYESWRTVVDDHHGPVFESITDDATAAEARARAAFSDLLFFDFVTWSLLQEVRAVLGCRVTFSPASTNRPGATDQTDTTGQTGATGRTDARGQTDGPYPTNASESLQGSDVLQSFEAAHRFASGHVSAVVTDVDSADLQAAEPARLGALHRRLVPKSTRTAFGSYYTPRGLAELAVEAVSDGGFADARVIDPGCGAGVFLVAAIERKRALLAEESAASALEQITSTVYGIDIDPTAVRAARLAYLLALVPLLETDDIDEMSGAKPVRIPVTQGDALGLGDADAGSRDGPPLDADVLLGNPPWLTWDRLSVESRRQWREGPIDRLGLFAYDGLSARLGFANDDVSVPFAWTTLDRYLSSGGRAAFLLKRDLLTGAAGVLLRSDRVGSQRVSMTGVHDFADLAPFGGDVGASTALYLFSVDPLSSGSGSDTASESTDDRFPVPTTVWTAPKRQRSSASGPASSSQDGVFGSLARMRRLLDREETGLVPVDQSNPTGPWIRADARQLAVGTCNYRIRHGVKDDAKAVFGLDRKTARRLEPDHVFPYLKSRHVRKFGLSGYDLQLVPQRKAGEDHEATLRRETPRTYAYLDRHRETLEARSSSWFDAGPFYNLFGLGPYTWAPYKVAWSRLGFQPHFAVVAGTDDPDLGAKPFVPGDHYMFVATEDSSEAHYLCALLNSGPYQRTLRELASGGKASLSKTTVSSLHLPRWEETPDQRRLARLSRRAHRIVGQMDDSLPRVDVRQSADSPLEKADTGDVADPSAALSAVRDALDSLVVDVLSGPTPTENENS